MPSYTVEFLTENGPQRAQFTLDPDRELDSQVRQVLEELRQHGLVIAGGADDEMTVCWHGRELDLARSPAALGVTLQRPLEIRMRPGVRPETSPRPAPVLPRRRVRRFTRGAYAGVLTGAAGGLVAWGVAGAVRDLNPLLPTYDRLDLFAGGVLGAVVGAFVLGGAALRRQETVVRELGLGLLLGVVGGLAGAWLGVVAASFLPGGVGAFRGARIAGWLLLGTATGSAVALRWSRHDPRRVLEGALCGLGGGSLGGAVFSLGGPGDFWQALAFALLGAAVGAGACSLALWRAVGVIEIESREGRDAGLLGHREWEVREGGLLLIREGGRSRAADATVTLENGRCWVGPAVAGEAVVAAGRVLAEPAELRDGERIDLGGTRFRFRRFSPVAA